MTPHISFAKSGPSPRSCVFRGPVVTSSRKAEHICSAFSLATEIQTIPQSKCYHTSAFSPAPSQLESPWTPYFICKMTGLLSNYSFHEIYLFFFRCESGYTGQHCEKTDFSILYVVPSRQKLTHVLIAAIIGAVQIAIIVAIVMCITR